MCNSHILTGTLQFNFSAGTFSAENIFSIDFLSMSNSKEQFLKTEFFIFSWKAATEHNLVWNKNTTDKAKGNFRKNIKEFLEDKLSKVYGKRKVTEEEHIKNIAELQSLSENLGKDLLIGDCLNFGTCQK